MAGAQVPISKLPVHSQLVDSISSALPGKVVLPGTDAYTSSNGSYFTAFENEISPACIAQPTTVDDVVALIKALRPALAGGKRVAALRGKGHMAWPGSANVQDGVTIDLQGLTGVKLSGDRKTVSIAAGETWGVVYETLAKEGLTVAGGRVNKIGAVGTILGGGLSYFSSQRGFASDNVMGFEVVLASGQVVEANRSTNTDLYRAIQGGSNNFGVVTRMDMAVFEPLDKFYGGMICTTMDNLDKLVDGLYGMSQGQGEGAEDCHLIWSLGYGRGMEVGVLTMYDTKGRSDLPALKTFQDLEPKIPQMTTLRYDNHRAFCEEQGSLTGMGQRHLQITTTIKPSVELIHAVYKRFKQALDSLKDSVAGLGLSICMQALTVELLRNSSAQWGGSYNSQGLKPEDGPLLIVLIFPLWTDPADDQKVISTVEKTIADIQALAQERGQGHRYIFPNYAWLGQNVLAGYGEERLAELKAAAQKWDPEGLFQKVIGGGFKVSEA